MKTRVTDDVVRHITSALAGGDWKLGRDLSRETGIPTRDIRHAIEDTGFLISSDRGYKLLALASPEEIERTRARLLSYAKKIHARVAALNGALVC